MIIIGTNNNKLMVTPYFYSSWPKLVSGSVFISSYCTPLAQRASYLALHSSLFGPDGAVNYDYIVTNSLLIGSKCITNGTHTNHC